MDRFIGTKQIPISTVKIQVQTSELPVTHQSSSFVHQQELGKLNFISNDLCHTCLSEGNLLLCDSCPKTYHLHCLSAPGQVADNWFCEMCLNKTEPKCIECSQLGGDVLCSLCHSVMHQDCVKVPLKLIQNGGQCGEFAQSPLCYVCRICQDARDIDIITQMFDPTTQTTNDPQSKPDQCFFYVKFNQTSYWHSVWLNYGDIQNSPKLKPFLKKIIDEIDEPNYTQTVSEILAVHHFTGQQWKYCLVKWEESEFHQSTWELTEQVIKRAGDEAWLRFLAVQQTQFAALHDSAFRLSLVTPQACVDQPLKLQSQLYPYQVEGIHWLLQAHRERRNVILGDEMGLGKTIQAIGVVTQLMRSVQRPYLIVAPLSTIENWRREFKQWCPEATVLVLQGSKQARQVALQLLFYFQLPDVKIPKFNVLLCSYEVLKLEIKTIMAQEWEVFCIDEGHRLKNSQSKLFFMCTAIRAKFKMLLSGTPLQNNFDELFNLLEFLDADKFNAKFRKEMERTHNLQATSTLSSDFTSDQKFLDSLSVYLKPHLLRRFKRDVIKDMPKRREVIVRVQMTSHQQQLMKRLITDNIQGLASATPNSYLLTHLRQAANHPQLLGQDYCTDNFSRLAKNLGVERWNTLEDLLQQSAKLTYLHHILAKILSTHKVLIFSQFKGMLYLVSDYLSLTGVQHLKLDGDTPNNQRQHLIDQFKRPEVKVFLLSTRAGGLGLNLTQADTVVIMDSDFNPHNDQQALARAHRIGQSQNVLVYRFVLKNSVEEKIVEMQKRKLMLDTAVQHTVDKETVMKVLRFGTQQLFQSGADQTQIGPYRVDEEQMSTLLDRDAIFDQQEEVGGDFLSNFNVAEQKVVQDQDYFKELAQQLGTQVSKQYTIHHDPCFESAKQVSGFEPNRQRTRIIESLQGKVAPEIIKVFDLNFVDSACLAYVKLFGLNFQQITDFQNALLKYGVKDNDLFSLFVKVQTYLQTPQPTELMSLETCPYECFKQIGDFTLSLISQVVMTDYHSYPLHFLNNLACSQFAQRSLDLELLSKIGNYTCFEGRLAYLVLKFGWAAWDEILQSNEFGVHWFSTVYEMSTGLTIHKLESFEEYCAILQKLKRYLDSKLAEVLERLRR